MSRPVDWDDLARVIYAGTAQLNRVATAGAAVRDKDRAELVRDLARRARRLGDDLAALIGEPRTLPQPEPVALGELLRRGVHAATQEAR